MANNPMVAERQRALQNKGMSERDALLASMKASKKDKASPESARPADMTAVGKTPGTSTSTGGATAHRNTGAATGGAVTITLSGSSSTETATTTGAGAGTNKDKGKGKGKSSGSEKPNLYHIVVNSLGKSGHAIDGAKTPDDDEDEDTEE